MQGILYEEPSFWLFALVTVVLGGWAAWMTGRAFALTWRSPGQAVASLLLLAWAVRFIHYALFEGTLLSLGTTSSTRRWWWRSGSSATATRGRAR
jgi:hypothetical protein